MNTRMKLLITTIALSTSAHAFAATPIKLKDSDARDMTKALKLLGVTPTALSRTQSQFATGSMDCDTRPIDVDSLPSYSCAAYAPAPTRALRGKIASMLMYNLLDKAGVAGEGHAGHYTLSVESIKCTIDSESGESACTLQPAIDPQS